jgi:hypothetical protein
VSIKSAFQAKRLEPDAPVRRPSNRTSYERDPKVTTTTGCSSPPAITKDATDARIRKAHPILLLVASDRKLMIVTVLVILRQPVYLYDIAAELFDFDRPED